MDKKIRFFALLSIALFLFACSSRRGSGTIESGGDVYTPKPVIVSPYHVKVAEVYNDTHQVYDVDIIGLLWNGMQDSLKKRGMLWTPDAEGDPYVLEGHVLSFREGGIPERMLPYLGDTMVSVRVELSQGGKHIATIESKRKIAFGKGTWTTQAWKKVFEEVSEDVVSQAVKKF